MAAQKTLKNTGPSLRRRAKVSRPGVHAKTKTSKAKSSKNYQKAWVGQGR